jgi:hypothetical protein
VRTLAPPDRKPRVRRARLHHDVSAAASHSKSDASATAGVKKRTSSREREGVRYAAVCRGAAEVVTQMRDCLRPAPKIRDRCHELFAFPLGSARLRALSSSKCGRLAQRVTAISRVLQRRRFFCDPLGPVTHRRSRARTVFVDPLAAHWRERRAPRLAASNLENCEPREC